MAGVTTFGLRERIDSLQESIDNTISKGVEVRLNTIIRDLKKVTPVQSGDMKAGYRVFNLGPREFQLVNQMFYSEYVIGGTGDGRIKPNAALNQALDRAIAEFPTTITATIDRLVRDLR